jgi:methionyl-tRNA formyltransferase
VKILFMGTPDFALPSLDALASSEQEVCGVVTQGDKRRGRNLVLSATPVKQRALALGFEVLQPGDLKDPGFTARVREMSPDLIAVVAYGSFLPRALWEMPPRGTINLHPSLLPKYRGAAPIQHAILNDEGETGVTVTYLGEKMDAGDIIEQERVAIRPDDTCESLGKLLAERGGILLLTAIRDIERGTAARVPQDEAAATFAGKIRKSEGLIDWTMPARSILLQVRAFYPWPGAYTRIPIRDTRVLLKILDAAAEPEGGAEAGVVAGCDHRGVRVGTGEGCLLIRRVQPEGRRAMDAGEFLCGYRDLVGARLG